MPLPLVTVTGDVLLPDGTGMIGGRIDVELVGGPATVSDGTTDHVVHQKGTYPIGLDGAVSFSILANDSMTPDTTSWRARFYPPDGRWFERTWTVLASPTSQDIGDL